MMMNLSFPLPSKGFSSYYQIDYYFYVMMTMLVEGDDDNE